jgi:hypothetical protein
MKGRPQRIHATDSDIATKLEQFDRWFWPPEIRGKPNVVPTFERPLPPLLEWARVNRFSEHRFVAEQQTDGRVLCFVECGGAFNGYLDPDDGSTNPLVSFDVDYQPPIPLNDLVVGAFFERFGFEPDDTVESESLPPDDQLIWTGSYLFVDEPVRVWIQDNRLVQDFGAIFDVPGVRSRPVINASHEVGAFSVGVPGSPHLPNVFLRRGVDVVLSTYRPKPPDSPTDSGSAAWTDIYRIHAEMLGFEATGSIAIPWPQLEPLWLAITEDLEPAYGVASDHNVHVTRVGADLGYDCTVGNTEALEQLRVLLRTASRA